MNDTGEMKMKKIIVLVFVITLIPLFLVSASSEKKIYTTRHINPHPPTIDGKLDDPVWQKIAWEGDFTQRDPYEGKAPSQKTAFKILYDDKNVYVALRAYDTEPEKIERRLSRRDEMDGDCMEIEIDSYFDHRTAFSFAVNASGVKRDCAISNDGDNQDDNWNPIWFVETSIDEQGWTAEMRIPLSQLRYGNKDSHIWGLQVSRLLFRKEELSQWQLIPKDAGGWVHQFGELHGIQGIKGQKQVELVPYTVGKLQQFQREEGNPFATGRLSDFVGGIDGKIGITSDLTLDFTINPDFGQVEADPSEVNLTAFETYFEEKRPFFIEGRNILNFRLMIGDGDLSSDNLFYSRRIGRRPHRVPDTGEEEYLDMPNNTSILGAFKLTGKTRSGLSIGIIESVTAEENAKISSLGQLHDEIVEPLTNYFGFRLQKDYNKGNTVIGTMLTATHRNLKSEDLNFLHDSAFTGGIDLYHSWKDKTYFLSFNAVFSRVHGSKEALLQTQESPLRYYQRPDADYVSLDPNRTSLAGYGGTLIAGKLGSGHLQYIGGFTFRSPGLELNDMGYLRKADNIMQFVWAGYKIWEPFAIFRRFNINFNQWQGWNFGGERTFQGGNIGFYGQFKNYWGFSVGINRQGKSLSSSSLRGGPSLRWPGAWNYWWNSSTDARKKTQINFGGSGSLSDEDDSERTSFFIGATYRPSPAMKLSIHPSYSVSREDLQYVSQEDFQGEKRYLFAQIKQKTLALTLRLDFCLTPDLSIQFYGQPFISAGKYSHFKNITDSRAKEFADRFYPFAENEISYDSEEDVFSIDENHDGIVDYSLGNPNFNFLQFRSNLVIRWEYRPGAALYLVWSQGRTGYDSRGDFSFGSDFRDLFSLPGHNVFLIKFSYNFQL